MAKETRDRSKLPKWAQNELQRLERDLEYYKREAAVGPEDSNTFAEPYADVPRPLGKDTTIAFYLEPEYEDRTPPHWLVRLREDGDLEVHYSGNKSMAFLPTSSNVGKFRQAPYNARIGD